MSTRYFRPRSTQAKQANAPLHAAVKPLGSTGDKFDPLLRNLREKTWILLGEATHGTYEFYQARVVITQRLITEQGISAIAIEGDWPAVYRLNLYVRWQSHDRNANEALRGFTRFPLWMWRNTVMLDFVEWLRQHNRDLNPAQQVGIYGLDMYSMYESVAAVLEYLDKVDADAARQARLHYGCLDYLGADAEVDPAEISCEEKVIGQLLNLREKSLVYAKPGDWKAEDDQFQAEQNARLIHSAEQYYRRMFGARTDTWNLRDSHMFNTLVQLQAFLSRRLQQPARVVLWEHNSHLGDASATSMAERGQHNVGQLVRQQFRDACYLVGFTTFNGTVTAASAWDGPAELKGVRDALPESIEYQFHQLAVPDFFLPVQEVATERLLQQPMLQRAIGVLYLPQSERVSHYFYCRLAKQFDAVLHFDRTSALQPLDGETEWQQGERQTYPFGV